MTPMLSSEHAFRTYAVAYDLRWCLCMCVRTYVRMCDVCLYDPD